MKNIIEIAKEFGLEIPQDKVSDFNKAVAENYKTIAEYDKKVQRLETERDGYKEQLTTAQDSLKNFENVDINDLQKQLEDAKNKATQAEKDFNDKLAARDFEDALRTEMGSYKFTSKAAEKSIMDQVKGAGLKCVNGKILGLNDYITTLKETDAEAFAEEGEKDPPAKFTSKIASNGTKKYTSRDEILGIKNRAERQQAIAENMDIMFPQQQQ